MEVTRIVDRHLVSVPQDRSTLNWSGSPNSRDVTSSPPASQVRVKSVHSRDHSPKKDLPIQPILCVDFGKLTDLFGKYSN
jgi:hypothetical protein